MKGEKSQDVETEEAVIEKKAEEDSSEWPHALEEETTEDRDDTYESLDFDFKTSEDLEEPVTDAFTEPPQDDLAEVMASLEDADRSEEHTSELQSHSFISYAVFCLKKKRSEDHTS